MSGTIIRTENLGRDFKTVTALDGLSLEVRALTGALLAADVLILVTADVRFRRNRLILD